MAGLAGAAALIAAITLASRLTGFARSFVLSAEVGLNALGSAYTTANTVPTVLFEVVAGGALAGAVVPLLAGPLARGARADLDQIVSALLGWTLVVLVPLGVLLAVTADPVAGLLLSDPEPGTAAVAAGMLRVFAVQIPLYGIAVVLFGLLQAHHRFAWPALAPLLNNVVVIGVLVVFGRLSPGSHSDPSAVAASATAWLAWGTTAGVGLMALAVVVPAARTGLRVRPTLRLPPGLAPRARSLALAGLGAVVAQQMTTLVLVWASNRFGGPGTVLVLGFVQQVYLLPYAVLAYPVVTATFPRMADRAAAQDRDGFAVLAARTTRTLVVLAVVGAAALVAGASGIEALYAAIAEGDSSGTAAALATMAPGLVGFVLGLHASRALAALHRGRAAGLTIGAGWVAVAVLVLVVGRAAIGEPDQVRALLVLAAASTVGMLLGGTLGLVALARAAGRSVLGGVLRTGVLSTVAGAAGAWLGRLAADAVLAGSDAGIGRGVLAAGVGAVVAVLVLGGALAVGDRGALRALGPVGRGGATSAT